MRTLNIAAIKQLENKEPIPSFTGRITKVHDQITDHGEYGQWWLQNLVVQDETGEVKVTWGGEDPFEQSAEGKTWSFECSETKHGLKGVSWEVKTKNGKTYESVKVTPSAKIKVLNGTTIPKAEQEADAERMFGRQDEIQDKGLHGGVDPDWPEAPPTKHDDGVSETRRHIMKSANLYCLCVKAVNNVVALHLPESSHTAEQFKDIATTMFIEASGRRSDDNVTWWSYIDKMPAKPLE